MGQLRIPARFNGPPTSANGGYACGLLATHLDGPVQVTLRVPPPLDRTMDVVEDDGHVRLLDGDTLVAEAEPATVSATLPATVAVEQAERATADYAGFEGHVFATCFVCGPDRAPGDGLRMFPGPVGDTGVVAAPWRPPQEVADDGVVATPFVWASLDCPSFFGGVREAGGVAVLGRMAAEVHAPVPVDATHVVLGWSRGREGRKHLAASALTTADGEVLAVAESTWIELREPPPT